MNKKLTRRLGRGLLRLPLVPLIMLVLAVNVMLGGLLDPVIGSAEETSSRWF
jgi:hypothetical protein